MTMTMTMTMTAVVKAKPEKHRGAAAIKSILRLLKKQYPSATTELNFQNPLQLLVATILAAQCTDERVNQVTASLFRKYRTAKEFAEADPQTLEQEVKPTGFYRAKTKSIIGACKMIVEKFNGEVPTSMDKMLQLPGVARKTANIVLGTAYGTPAGIAVDTHVHRVARRLGLTREDKPDRIEQDLMNLVAKKRWSWFGHALTLHGRYVCLARKPRCPECPLERVCGKVGVQ